LLFLSLLLYLFHGDTKIGISMFHFDSSIFLKKNLFHKLEVGDFLSLVAFFISWNFLYFLFLNTTSFLGTPSKFYFFVHVFNNVHPHSSTIFNMHFHISFTWIHMFFLHPCLHLCLSTLWLLVIHLINNVHSRSSTFLYQCP
jgi:hypothetical protein